MVHILRNHLVGGGLLMINTIADVEGGNQCEVSNTYGSPSSQCLDLFIINKYDIYKFYII